MSQIDPQAFTQRWIVDLVNSLDEHLDEETRQRVMESCGRSCARSGPVRVARQHAGDLDGWLGILVKWHSGEEYVQRDGSRITVLCQECVCPVVKDIEGTLPDTYCNCSLGWMKETFETVVGEPVDVTLVESVVRGGQMCRFVICV